MLGRLSVLNASLTFMAFSIYDGFIRMYSHHKSRKIIMYVCICTICICVHIYIYVHICISMYGVCLCISI